MFRQQDHVLIQGLGRGRLRFLARQHPEEIGSVVQVGTRLDRVTAPA